MADLHKAGKIKGLTFPPDTSAEGAYRPLMLQLQLQLQTCPLAFTSKVILKLMSFIHSLTFYTCLVENPDVSDQLNSFVDLKAFEHDSSHLGFRKRSRVRDFNDVDWATPHDVRSEAVTTGLVTSEAGHFGQLTCNFRIIIIQLHHLVPNDNYLS